jgi:hypothetical protein
MHDFSWAQAAGQAREEAHRTCTVLLVRGLFGAWIPGHFAVPLQRLRREGWTVEIARTEASGTVARNIALLAQTATRLAAAGRRLVFLAHSKGGLEVLLMLAARPDLAAETAGLVTVQTARAGAPYLESLFSRVHPPAPGAGARLAEVFEAAALSAAGARPACAELNTARVQAWVAQIDAARFAFPWLAVATHAGRATWSLEMKHRRLSQIAPGQPHDGVFYTQHQRWPQAQNLLVPGVDHAQPSTGANDFAHGHFWSALLGGVLAAPAAASVAAA